MVLKLVIGDKGKAYKLEIDTDKLSGKKVGEVVKGDEVSGDLQGYEIEITGGSDSSGFPMKKDVEGIGLKRVLLKEGWGMHKVPRGVKKKNKRTPKGIRLRKTVRGNTLSDKTVQVNMKVVKSGDKKLEELYGKKEEIPVETVKEEKSVEEKKE